MRWSAKHCFFNSGEGVINQGIYQRIRRHLHLFNAEAGFGSPSLVCRTLPSFRQFCSLWTADLAALPPPEREASVAKISIGTSHQMLLPEGGRRRQRLKVHLLCDGATCSTDPPSYLRWRDICDGIQTYTLDDAWRDECIALSIFAMPSYSLTPKSNEVVRDSICLSFSMGCTNFSTLRIDLGTPSLEIIRFSKCLFLELLPTIWNAKPSI